MSQIAAIALLALRTALRSRVILVLLLLVVIGGFSATTEGFLDFYNLSDSTFNYSEKALIA